jgi:alpha/beta superfamily hydrolase
MQQAHDRLVGAAGAYGATERVVDFQNRGQKIIGTLALPDGGAQPYPVVLLFHGFTVSRDALPVTGTEDNLFSRTARTLAEHGFASLRIDFRGSGESEGQWEDTTFSGQIADALAAIDYLATLPEIDLQRLAVLGFSQGGLVAAETAARDPRVKSVVLWGAVADPPDTYKLIVGADKVAAGLQSGGEAVHVELMWGAETDLKTPFFEDLYNVNPVAAMRTVTRPLLVVVGLQDTIVTPQPHYGEIYLNYHEGAELLVAVDSDHVFNVASDQGPAVLDDVIAWTLAWVQQTLPAPGPR